MCTVALTACGILLCKSAAGNVTVLTPDCQANFMALLHWFVIALNVTIVSAIMLSAVKVFSGPNPREIPTTAAPGFRRRC